MEEGDKLGFAPSFIRYPDKEKMVIFGIIFQGLANMIHLVCSLLYLLLCARIIISWLPVDPYSSIVQFLVQVTDPVLAPLRRLPLRLGMLDLSPIVAFIVLQLLENITVRILLTIARRLGAG